MTVRRSGGCRSEGSSTRQQACSASWLSLQCGGGILWNLKCHGALVDRLVVRINQFNQHFVRTWRQPPKDEGVPLASAQCHGASSTVT